MAVKSKSKPESKAKAKAKSEPKPEPKPRPKVTPKPEPQQNHLLAALSPEVQKRLFPYLELVPLPLRALMYESGRPMRHVYFPTDSIVSLQYVM